jgi:hypothetical protein
MWKVAAAIAAVVVLAVSAMRPAAADILINVSKASQRMSVLVDGTAKYNWLVSTGSKRHTTPSGAYKPTWMAKKWRSRQYRNAPMPHSIFFHNGYAIHGTTEIKRLGKIASHGCVRLHPDNAAKLFSLVAKEMASTRIVVSNDVIDAPAVQLPKPKRKPGQYMAEAPADAAPNEVRGKLETVALAVDETPPREEKRAGIGKPAFAKIAVNADKRERAEKAGKRERAAKRERVEKALAQEQRTVRSKKSVREAVKPVRERFARAGRGGFAW